MVKNIGVRLFQMQNEDIMTDVTFVVDGSEVKGHRDVMSSHGGPLQDLLKNKADKVEIEELSLRPFLTVLEYFYTDRCTIDNTNVFELLLVAKKFKLGDLMTQCTRVLKSKLSEENIGLFTEHALYFDAKELLEDCKNYFAGHTVKVINRKEFQEVPNEVLITLCDCEKLECSELNLFQACIEWAKFQCQQRKKDGTSANLKAVLGDVLSKIRFTNISMEDFQKYVLPTEVLNYEEIGRIVTGQEKKEKRDIQSTENAKASEVPKKNEEPSLTKVVPENLNDYEAFIKSLGTTGQRCSELEVFAGCVQLIKNWRLENKVQTGPEDVRAVLGNIIDRIKFTEIPVNDFLDFVVPMEILTAEEVGRIIVEMQRGKWKSLPYGFWTKDVEVNVAGYGNNRVRGSTLKVPFFTRVSELKTMKIFERGKKEYLADNFTLTCNGEVPAKEMSLLSILETNILVLNRCRPVMHFEIDSIDVTVKADHGEWEYPLRIETQDLWERDFNVIKGFVYGLENIDPDDVKRVIFSRKVPGATAVVIEY